MFHNLKAEISRFIEEWNNSYIVSLFKGKSSALDRGNYHGLKLTDQVLSSGKSN